MLDEAVAVIRELWKGDTVDHRGRYYEIENARVFDAPRSRIPIIVSGFGTKAAALAGRIGDGYWGTAPDQELLDAFEQAGGHGPRYAQLTICWADDEESANKTVHDIWPNAGLSGQLSQDLPTWTHFEQAAEPLTPEQVTASLPCGPDIVDDIVDSARAYVAAGYDHLYLHQVGPDQEGFFEFWQRELQPALTSSLSMTDDLTGVARGSETLIDVLARFRREGFTGSFTPLQTDAVSTGARLRCEQCRAEFAAEEPTVTELRRLEGASDPDDMLAAIALECPRCAARGSLVVNYGPTATTGEAAVLVALQEPRRNPS
jgi:hypothetical protein